MIDNSSLQTYKNCPEQFRLRYVLGLKKREEDRDEHDANFGAAIHTGLEYLYKGKSMEEAKEAFSKDYPIQLNGEDLAKTQANGLILLDAYRKHYEAEDRLLEVLGVEVKDIFSLGPIDFLVKIDLIVRKQGCVYFVDHKTTGKTFNWQYWSRFEPNPQITAYTAYCRTKYGECSGGIINAIRLGHRQKKYLDQPAGFYYEFQRQLFNRNQYQIEAWREDTIAWAKQLEGAKDEAPNVPWRKNEGQCGFCSFKEVCISVADDQIIEQLYEKVNPLEYLNDNGRAD